MRYSRLGSVEEKRNKKTAFKFVIYTIISLGLLFFFGIPLLGRFAAFISDIKGGQSPISKNDNTPPAPPLIDSLPEFTNQKGIKLTGTSEEAATVKLVFNSKESEVVAGNDGKFSFDISLKDGENSFKATSIDTAGNVSQETKIFTVTFDDEAPELKIDLPSNGQQFFGPQQRQIEIKGSTDAESQITINDRFVSVDDGGAFQFTTTLNEGENKFYIKSTDQAGNFTETELTLNFTS